MTKKNKNKVAARARQANGGNYQSHLRAVGGGGDVKPLGFFEIISNAIRQAHPTAKLSFDDPTKRLDVRVGPHSFAFLTPHNVEPAWPVAGWNETETAVESERQERGWDCTSIDDVLTVLRWPNAPPSGAFTSVNEIRDDYENPSKHVWARAVGDALRSAFQCEGCTARIYVNFGETVEEVARMGFANWRSRQSGAIPQARTNTRSMGVAAIPPQCGAVAEVEAPATDEASVVTAAAEKTGKRAAHIPNREQRARELEPVAESPPSPELPRGPIYILPQVYEGARRLFERRPETPSFTTSVNSYKLVDDRIGPNGEVAMVPLLDITFVEDTPAHWWFDNALAFIDGELYDGPRPVQAVLLDTEQGRKRLSEIIVAQIRSEQPWFAEKLTHFRVKSGFQRGDNLIVVVSLALVDEQEKEFGEIVQALQEAEGQASIAMATAALTPGSKTPPIRRAIALARIALASVQAAAETDRQKALAQRALGYEKKWRRDEESLDRIEARNQGLLLPIMNQRN